jgi:histidyl-tRNA synthetase
MADKPPKRNKLKARLPRGLTDRRPAEIAATREMVEKIRLQFERYGFEPVETPAIEYTDALGKFLPDQDRPNEGVFSFQDDDEQWLSLRYDLTAPLARYVAENFQSVGLPYRSYRHGWVFRNEKPGPGRYRQFLQFDADTIGSASVAADAEMCMLAADTMEVLGVPRGSYVVKVNNRKVLDGVLQAIGLGGNERSGSRLTVLRAIDKLDRINVEGVKLLLGPGRKDESGDVTKGAGLSTGQIDIVIAVVTAKSVPILKQILDQITMNTSDVNDPQGRLGHLLYDDAVNEMIEQFEPLVRSAGYRDDRIRFDPTVVRGLEYYTGPVYEVELLIETKDDKSRPVRFGSVGGGGRYDGLVSRFMSQPVPATGFSIGVSRLQAALTLIGKLDSKPPAGPVLVTVFDAGNVAGYQKMVTALRNAGIRAELYLGNHKHGVGQQLKYADKRNSPCAVIQGSDEKAKGEIQIKDLILGASLTGTTERDEHLKKQAEAQFAVPEKDLVAGVLKVLKRHKLA